MDNNVMGIDPTISSFKRLGHSLAFRQILRPNTISQPVIGTIGKANTFFLGFKRRQIGYRSKYFFDGSYIVKRTG